jgi:hypothetical protein
VGIVISQPFVIFMMSLLLIATIAFGIAEKGKGDWE